MAEPHTLQVAAYEAAKKFLETLVIVDDGALQSMPGPSLASTPKVGIGAHSSSVASGAVAATPGDSPIAYEDISRAAMKEGIFAVLVRPDPPEESGASQVALDLLKADIIVLDWRIQGIEDGLYATWIIKSLQNSKPFRKRQVICIYSNYPDSKEALLKLASNLGLTDEAVVHGRIISGGLVIVWKAKVAGVNGMPATAPDELPRALITEFASRHTGLVPLIALDALTAVRLNTLPILERYSSEADIGFAFDAMLLGGISEVVPALWQALGDDLSVSVLATASSSVPRQTEVDAWLELAMPRHDSLPNGLKQATLEGSRIKIRNLMMGTAEQSGIDAAQDKKKRKKIADCFYSSGAEADNFAKFVAGYTRFSALLSTRYWPEGRPSVLGLGTIIADSEGQYWVSVQPSCDSVRLTSVTKFPFVPLVSLPDSPSNMLAVPVVHEAQEKLYFSSKTRMADAVIVSFEPDPTQRAVISDGGEFKDQAGIKWRFVGVMRMSHAHRVLQVLTDHSGRIGVTEGELGRKLGMGK